jgi:prostaglandin reductase 1
MKARKWVLVHHFEGFPKDSDLELQEEDLPELKDGDILLEALYLTVDPYMRPYSMSMPLGSVMIGQQLAKVVKSKNAKFREGQLVLALVGWRDKTVINPDSGPLSLKLPAFSPAYDTGSFPPSLNLSLLGIPGLSAYFGLLRICEPKPGETVFVNSAAGIVGSIVGQIAKIKGCRVIGCAGSADKCKWLTSELGFDYAFNYKTTDVSEALKESAPNGIDCYFDNVGGDMSISVIEKHMNQYGRITCCGVLSAYNAVDPPKGPQLFSNFVSKELKMQGFMVATLLSEFPAALTELHTWLKQGKLKYREDIVDGFENMRTAFYGMLRGNYTGKVLVKASPR